MSKVHSKYGEGVDICVSWQEVVGGKLPSQSVKAGNKCYVGRALHKDEYIPGKLFEGHSTAYVSYGGKEHSKSEFEVLVKTSALNGDGIQWKEASDGELPSGAIVGGSDNGQPLYIARSEMNGETVVGKYFPQHGKAYFPYGGNEHQETDVDVLCCVTKNA